MYKFRRSSKHRKRVFLCNFSYGCDEGVRRNGGRVGAADGPDSIKKQFGKLAASNSKELELIDVGNVVGRGADIENASNLLGSAVETILRKGYRPLLLGGGHDMAYGHYKGIRDAIGKSPTIGIINIDAHFDLRPNIPAMHSGSPFYQIFSEANYENNVSYLCLGINENNNPNPCLTKPYCLE